MSKQNTKILQSRKKHRRQWLTFLRMVRYGANNFTRNAWLTVAATAVMTITLLIIFMTVAAQHIMQNLVGQISKTTDMSIYLKTETTLEQAAPIMDGLRRLSNTQSVTFKDSEEAREEYAQKNKQDGKVLDALNEASNKFSAIIRVTLHDINDTSQLSNFVKNNETLKTYIDPDREPTFAGPRRTAIENIAKWTVLAQQIGMVMSAVFVVISSLIIFNTIRMAIFSRKEEIQMMKLVGADRHFIRGPFIVEAIVYGFIAAVLATVLGYFVLRGLRDGLQPAGVDVNATISLFVAYGGFVLLGMITLGGIIGIISSLFATRRYLKL